MDGEVQLEHRLTQIETILQERKAVREKFEKKVDKKLDEILKNGKALVSLDALGSAITTHAENCPKGNPNGKDVLKENWQVLLIMGGALAGLVKIVDKLIDFII